MYPWIVYYPWTFILVFLFLSIEMSYCSGTDQFPKDIYLLKVNNKHTRGKFIYFKQHIFLLKP